MKRIVILITVLFITTSIIAQTNTFPSSGNVGIGTISPGQKLHVVGNILVHSGSQASSGEIDKFIFAKDHTSGGGYTYTLGEIRSFTSNGYAGGLNFYTGRSLGNGSYGSVYAMGLNENGNLGIGTSGPVAKLNIVDIIKTNTALIIGRGDQTGQAGLPNTYGYPYVRIGGSEYDNNYTNLSKQTIGFGYVPGGFSPAEIGVEITNWSSSGQADIVFATRYGVNNIIPTERMRITSGGNVGVGTINPSEKLSVNGNIRTQKLIVTQLGWSDYVFEPSYKLRKLSDVEAFIKTSKHLPEMPSAKEVSENGISVGDNQTLLLKKIEELTLYLIEQQKRIEALEKQIKQKRIRRSERK